MRPWRPNVRRHVPSAEEGPPKGQEAQRPPQGAQPEVSQKGSTQAVHPATEARPHEATAPRDGDCTRQTPQHGAEHETAEEGRDRARLRMTRRRGDHTPADAEPERYGGRIPERGKRAGDEIPVR